MDSFELLVDTLTKRGTLTAEQAAAILDKRWDEELEAWERREREHDG